MTTIDRSQLQQMIDKDAVTVVEVLGQQNFNKAHLPGAINVPLTEDFTDDIQAAVPDKDAAVVVYCMDADCDASPKAASMMDDLGYSRVYDYEAGKKDWANASLPMERD